ncbi:MAG: agmatinase [Bacteriovoracia bacterium]
MEHPRFGSIATFNRLPHVANIKGKKVDVAIMGVPYDGAASFRPGTRFGPRAIREASVLCRNYNPAQAVHVYDALNVVDAGDISINPLNIQKTYKAIESRLGEIHDGGARAICVGGDHSISLPCFRAVHKKYGDFVLVHFDAHTDTADQAWGEKLHHGTWVRRAIEEKILTGPRIFQIGIRGPLTAADQEKYSTDQGINTLDIDSFFDKHTRTAFFAKIKKVAGKKPVYLTFDIDAVDPAYAPGTGTPVVGGMTSYEALQAVRALKGVNLVGADLVEVSPPYDQSDITSLLGAAIVFEMLSLMA